MITLQHIAWGFSTGGLYASAFERDRTEQFCKTQFVYHAEPDAFVYAPFITNARIDVAIYKANRNSVVGDVLLRTKDDQRSIFRASSLQDMVTADFSVRMESPWHTNIIRGSTPAVSETQEDVQRCMRSAHTYSFTKQAALALLKFPDSLKTSDDVDSRSVDELLELASVTRLRAEIAPRQSAGVGVQISFRKQSKEKDRISVVKGGKDVRAAQQNQQGDIDMEEVSTDEEAGRVGDQVCQRQVSESCTDLFTCGFHVFLPGRFPLSA